jgi:GNAT superfamily N-acetyltransferase
MASEAAEFVRLRGRSRENTVSETRLASFGITPSCWAADVRAGLLAGITAKLQDRLLGYWFRNTRDGEVVVLALLPEAEGGGIGRELLGRVVLSLRECGYRRLFLGCSSNPNVRSYGFYRRLGWRPTGAVDSHADDVLELNVEPGSSTLGMLAAIGRQQK